MRTMTRRKFLRTSAAISGTAAVQGMLPVPARAADGLKAPSERITIGLIGKGLMGSGHLSRLVGDPAVQVLAVCDVDQTRREDGRRHADHHYAADRRSGRYRGCAAYRDYREVLARDDIDAVLIATPDHWHALLAVEAARAGKDVYCEKPVSLTIQEGRQLARTLRRCGRVFQTGTQYRSIPTIRQV
ncbi:unnamed protein product, partial [marine sediment metagenome]